MSRHVIAFTYAPKIEGVRNGTICQTIRPTRKRRIWVGDTLLLHGWEGKPYRSKWSWRMEVTCSEVIDITMDWYYGIFTHGGWFNWESMHVRTLAVIDGIRNNECSAGVNMRALFADMYGLSKNDPFTIIRWGVVP